jgi:protein O-GlcNAc transferase
MKKSQLICLFRTPLIVVCVSFLTNGAPMTGSAVQAQDSNKKVLQKTTDKSGFEKQLTETDLMHQTASQLMSAGQWQEAATELTRVVAAEPDRVSGWSDLAKCYNNLKQYDKAAEAYAGAIKYDPDNLDLLSNLGFAQLNAQQLDSAVGTYQRMLEVDPLSYDANVHLGFIFQKSGDATKAIGYYEKALEGRNDDVATMGSLAKLYADTGDLEKSRTIYLKAIDASKDPAQKNQLRSKLGKALIAEKNWVEASEVFSVLASENPENAAYQFNYGISLQQCKQDKEAIPHLEKVIQLRPDYIQAYQQLAAAYNEVGRYDDAIRTVKTALPQTDQKGGLYCTWGRSLEKQQLYDEAIDMFQKAVNDPQWGGYAKKQIERQADLKKRAAMIKEQQG